MINENLAVSRRKFLDSITTAALAVPFLANSAVSFTSTEKKLRHACIGVGGMGWHDLQNFKEHPNVQIVALCDVDAKNLQKAAEVFPDARTYSDWRELLEKEGDNIDSVNVTVPDHNHFAIAYRAIQNGKHVYCQKPLCHDVAEVRKLTEVAIKAGVITQLGTQHASGKGDRSAVQILKDGVIGKVKHAYLCSNRPEAIERYRLPGPRPPQGQDVPSHLNWDLWTGTAPMRPYAPNIYHPAIWRAWQDFGTGWSGDIGCHILDAVWKGLDLKAPISVMARVQDSWQESSERNGDTWPQGDHITWMFPGNELTASDILPLEWFDGEFYPPWEVQALFHGKPYPAESALLIGTEGALLMPHKEMPVLLPENKYVDYQMPTLEDRNHYHHFVDACLGSEKNDSHFAQSGPMTEAILLGTVAIRMPDTVLKWDPVNMSFPNQPKANKFLQREYRKGWGVAGF
ncbi:MULTISPECIES: Gfo/Idh/MocA family protein [Arenibacter]|uniref:Gfo/Idh/MocA family protein n=1 Tax=Arenibacter TaxID=178469 RepID=UPI0004DF80F6|nr:MULTISPECIES: Gfo/Idh/MocA family oxidoreductase [Arenibacter]GBF20558.1 inositol 2-dehydrogenase [Arenibacter sp. NBRC 103722]